ncbi:hypothetical protein HW432_10455 [Bacillus pumilus]|uniref:hypothetical protein n=1 Tax=Bacillus pumilus TaxID=1408 RepID=UPI0016092DE4|nr:hypothetical protein [Bacillus pumilus]MBB6602704.1 hypothetical protein [Bacillus pumilus]
MKITVHKMERQKTQAFGRGTLIFLDAEVILDNDVSFKACFKFPGIEDISFDKAAELVQEHLKHGIA